jgi:hypothetical protein
MTSMHHRKMTAFGRKTRTVLLYYTQRIRSSLCVRSRVWQEQQCRNHSDFIQDLWLRGRINERLTALDGEIPWFLSQWQQEPMGRSRRKHRVFFCKCVGGMKFGPYQGGSKCFWPFVGRSSRVPCGKSHFLNRLLCHFQDLWEKRTGRGLDSYSFLNSYLGSKQSLHYDVVYQAGGYKFYRAQWLLYHYGWSSEADILSRPNRKSNLTLYPDQNWKK